MMNLEGKGRRTGAMKKRYVTPFDSAAAKRAVLKVGGGRGFILEIPLAPYVKDCHTMRRIVVTAAHCLPHLPPAMSFAPAHEKTYASLLGSLGKAKPSIMAECLFVDPVADIAALCEADGQASRAYSNGADAYEALMQTTSAALSMSRRNTAKPVTGWLLSLDGHWAPCKVTAMQAGMLWITEAIGGIFVGMSGSPILLDDGKVIGVMSACSGRGDGTMNTEGGPQPRLSRNLPGWIVKEL